MTAGDQRFAQSVLKVGIVGVSRLEGREHRNRGRCFARSRLGIAEEDRNANLGGTQAVGSVVFLQSVGQIAFARISEAEIEVNRSDPGRQFDCGTILGNGGVHLPRVGEGSAEIDPGSDVFRARLEKGAVIADRGGEIAFLLLFNGAGKKLIGRGRLRLSKGWN
jgi:hypothetical protein